MGASGPTPLISTRQSTTGRRLLREEALRLFAVVLFTRTLLPLLAAAAGAGVVAADFDPFADYGGLLYAAVAAAGFAGDLGHPLALHGALAVAHLDPG